MIDLLTNDELRSIAEAHSPHCVSMYLPTHKRGQDVQQDPIRLKNLISRAAGELGALGLKRDEADEFLSPAARLLKDPDFWAHGEEGLAVLVDDQGMRTFHLGDAPDDLLVVADRFHVKPLLRSLSAGEAYWILAISQNHIRLLRGGPNGAAELGLGDIPESLAAALWFEDRERQLQSHGANRVGSGRVSATFHGQGMGRDTQHSDLGRFLRAVDDGVRHLTAGGGEPIVLAGVERDLAAFREVSRTEGLLSEAVTGNCDHKSPDELHSAAWPIVSARFEMALNGVRDAIAAGNGSAETHLAAAHVAAEQGRVESLVVALGVQLWGRAGEDSAPEAHAERLPGDRDLLDAVAIETMRHGGSVHAVDPSAVPGGGHLAALLRW